MIRRHLIGCIATFGALALVGCSTVPKGALQRTGRFSLSARTPRGIENFTGRFVCTRAGDVTQLDLLTPLSGVLMRIISTPSGTELYRGADTEPVRGQNLDALLSSEVGFALPVAALELIATGTETPESFTEGAWHVRILARDASNRAQRIRFEHTTEPTVILTVFLESSV